MTDTFVDTVQLNFDTDAQWVLNVILAFITFGIALEISVKDFKKVRDTPKAIFAGILSQFLLLPVITFILVYFLMPSPSIALGMFLLAACPGGNVSNFMTHMAKGNTALSVSLTAFGTALSVIMTPFNLQFWGGLYEPTSKILNKVTVSPYDMFIFVAFLLGLPLILGMLINNKFPKTAKQLARVFKTVSLLFFVVLVFVALYNNRDVFMIYVGYVLWLVVAHNTLAFATGFSVAKLFKLSKEDLRSVTMETGIQNSGLGLILVFSFFEGLGGMALVTAFWGIWHLVSGLSLGGFWSKRPL